MNAFSYISPRDPEKDNVDTTIVLMDHIKFLASHHMDMEEMESEDMARIITQCDIDENNTFQ